MGIEQIAEQEKTFKEVLQYALEDGAITKEELININEEFEEEKNKLDYTKQEAELLIDIVNIFVDTKDELKQLQEILDWKKKDKKQVRYDFSLADISSSLELMMWSYSYEDNTVLGEYFIPFFKEGKVLSDFFPKANDANWCKENNISGTDIIELSKKITLNNTNFEDFKKSYNSIKDKVSNPIEEINFLSSMDIYDFSKISELFLEGIDKKYIEDNGLTSEILIEMCNKEWYDFDTFIKYNKLFLGAHEAGSGTFKFSEFYSEINCNDINGTKIIDSLWQYIDNLPGKSLKIELYKGSNRTIDLSIDNNKGVQFFMGLCQFIQSNSILGDKSEIKDMFVNGQFNNDWIQLISEYERSLTNSIDKGANHTPDKVFMLIENDSDPAFRNRKEVINLYENIYGKQKVDDINHSETPREIVENIENNLRDGKKILFILGLHGFGDKSYGEQSGSVQYSGGQEFGHLGIKVFRQEYFELIKGLQSKYKDKEGNSLLTLNYTSCNSGYKHQNNDFGGDVFMDSGKHKTSALIMNVSIEGGANCYFSKEQPTKEGYVKRFIKNIECEKETSKGKKYRDLLFSDHQSGQILQKKYLEKPGKILNLYSGDGNGFALEFKNYDSLIVELSGIEELYLDSEHTEKIDTKEVITYLKNIIQKELIIPADYNGDGKVSHSELHIYQMEKYKGSSLPTYTTDESGNIIRLSDNANPSLYHNFS